MDRELDKALYKGFLGAGIQLFTEGGVYVSLRDHDKSRQAAEVMARFAEEGFRIYGSAGTSRFLRSRNIPCLPLSFAEAEKKIGTEIQVIVNVPRITNNLAADMFPIRRMAVEKGLPVLTCIDTARAYMQAVKLKKDGTDIGYQPLNGKPISL